MPSIWKKIISEKQRINKTIKTLKNDEYTSVLKAHRAFNVPYQKLLQRYNGRPAADSLAGHNKTLDDAQEQALLQYIDHCSELGRPCKHKHIELAANSILRASDSPNIVSWAWISWFIKHHKVHWHHAKSLSAQCKAAQKCEDIESHFTKFQRDYRQYHIKSCNLHNFDETGFQVDCLAGQIVFNHTDKQVYT